MTFKLPLIAAGLVLATTNTGIAFGAKDHVVDFRRTIQAERIEQGRRTGEITWAEGIKLRAQQRRIDAAERAFRADDGRIDRHEYRQLKVMQDEATRRIAAEAHDGRARPGWLPRIGR